MASLAQTRTLFFPKNCDTVAPEATPGALSLVEVERMARRRYQDPAPQKLGRWWYLLTWQDDFVEGKRIRKRKRIKLAPATMAEREVKKIAAEILRPLNQGLIVAGSAVNFMDYVNSEYASKRLPKLASTTQASYKATIRKYLEPVFADCCLRDLTRGTLDKFFVGLAEQGLAQTSLVKVRDTLSSILRQAQKDNFMVNNPLQDVDLPPDRSPRRKKPRIDPEQFTNLLALMTEPYATMAYVAVWTGLRVSELLALRWSCVDVNNSTISIEERYCRGDWARPKTEESAATIPVEPHVIARIQRLKQLTVEVRAGRAVRQYRVVKTDGPDDLVFQSLQGGGPMNDQNILKRHIQPAARQLKLHVTWRCLRTSHATWLIQAGADPKSVQAQMRHSRIETTLGIYAQVVPETRRQSLRRLSRFAKKAVLKPVPKPVPLLIQ